MISSALAACAALLVGPQSGGGESALQVCNAFAPMHIGVDVPGFGGLYRIDAPDVVATYRITAQSDGEVSAVWLFYRTVGAPGPFELSVYATKQGDPTLRDLSHPLYCVPVTPHAPAAKAGWERVPLGQTRAGAISRGDVLHVVVEPALGAKVDADNRVELVTTRARSTLNVLPGSRKGAQLVSIVDDAFAFLYARKAHSPLDARAQIAINAEYLPIVVLEEAGGALFGQPCDVHYEEHIFGTHGFGEIVRLSGPVTIDFVAMYTRGAGDENSGRPSDHLYLDIIERDLRSGASKPVTAPVILARSTDRLFKGRSHWFGRFLGGPLTLAGGPGKEYALILSSPGSLGEDSDAWIYNADGSTFQPKERCPGFGMEESRACRVELPTRTGKGGVDPSKGTFTELGPAADAPFRLGLFGARGPCAVALLDEVQVNRIGPDGAVQPGFPLVFAAGDTVQFAVQARDIGADTISGGAVFARFVDRVSGRIVAGPQLFPMMPGNNERGSELSFMMPPADLRLSLEIGHLDVAGGSGLPIVDDVTSWEIRVR